MLLPVVRSLVGLGVLWHAVHPGVWQRETMMAHDGPLAVVRAVVVRLDPARVRFTLDTATRDYGMRGGWTIDALRSDAVLAFNAGQFAGGWPWGWLVRDGVEEQPPGNGTLGMAFVVDTGGHMSLVMPKELAAVRTTARLAFQSYPALLAADGQLPYELQVPGRGVDLEHRDSRLALGLLADGSLVVALTRFTGLGRRGETLPWGPTVPEMAAFMRSLGCRRAMLLDGGMSSQLVLRDSGGRLLRWPNWRPVPLALVVTRREGG
jgi:exopolysaccharide biosynthesis protein